MGVGDRAISVVEANAWPIPHALNVGRETWKFFEKSGPKVMALWRRQTGKAVRLTVLSLSMPTICRLESEEWCSCHQL